MWNLFSQKLANLEKKQFKKLVQEGVNPKSSLAALHVGLRLDCLVTSCHGTSDDIPWQWRTTAPWPVTRLLWYPKDRPGRMFRHGNLFRRGILFRPELAKIAMEEDLVNWRFGGWTLASPKKSRLHKTIRARLPSYFWAPYWTSQLPL